MKFDVSNLQWTRQPESCSISPDRIEIVNAARPPEAVQADIRALVDRL